MRTKLTDAVEFARKVIAADRAARGAPEWLEAALKRPFMVHHKMSPEEMAFADGWNELRKRLLSKAPKPEPQPAAQPDSAARGVPDEMDSIASKYAHKLALDLECVLADYSGKWWDTAIKTIGEYREAMNAIHERESPTFMGEPRL
jgi:hypothetical protein